MVKPESPSLISRTVWLLSVDLKQHGKERTDCARGLAVSTSVGTEADDERQHSEEVE